MDLNEPLTYHDLREIYTRNFSLGNLNTDINNKFALISLTAYVTYKLKQKKPDVTVYQVLQKITESKFSDDFIKGIAVMIEDFSYGCTQFPTFGIEPKKIPSKIKEIMDTYFPF